MSTIKVIGIDLDKSSFQLVGHEHTGREQFSKHLSRSKLIQFLSQIPTSTIAMDSCCGPTGWQ
jgi:hypothetical protein